GPRDEGGLEAPAQVAVGGRDDGGEGLAGHDLGREVRARENGDRPSGDERGEAAAGRRVEALAQAQYGRAPRQAGDDLAEDAARDGDADEGGPRGPSGLHPRSPHPPPYGPPA